jgi:hypothetical protein
MLSIMVVLGTHEFVLYILLRDQGGTQISSRREDFAYGGVVFPTLREGLEIELSEFEAENGTPKGDCLRQVVAIVIGGV